MGDPAKDPNAPPAYHAAPPPGAQPPPVQGGYPAPQQGYPAPQQGYQQGYPAPQPAPGTYPVGGAAPVTVVMAVGAPQFREVPIQMQCQFCHVNTVTQSTYKSGLLVWLICGAIILCGGILGCCLIPFCIDALKDVEHTCANCHKVVGKYNRLG